MEIVIGASVTGVTDLGRDRETNMSISSPCHEPEKRFHYRRRYEPVFIFSLPGFWVGVINYR